MSQTPQRNAILHKVAAIISEQLSLPTLQISETTTAKDVDGWDSLAHVTIILAIEKEFSFKLRTSEIGKLQNVAGLIDVILQRGRIPASDVVSLHD